MGRINDILHAKTDKEIEELLESLSAEEIIKYGCKIKFYGGKSSKRC